jgi:UDP-N-acetylmuramate: L-alanyl-gamma-D-glutamyl-meso-diaminopimelate ligase
MKVHFIAIGGSAMHNLAIALKENGADVSGSDDEVFEPSRSRLASHNILPDKMGWFPQNIHEGLDAIILGMHARADNPELLRAVELGLKVYSYPEYLYEQCKNKKRVVIGGSHGKTTVTSMIMHVLRHQGVDFDYMVGAQLEGFDTMVHLSPNSKIAVFEGDEYLSSPIDLTPKFFWYKPHIALLTGIAWDHINVFPTIENYNEQFKTFIGTVHPDGLLTYFAGDPALTSVVSSANASCRLLPYQALPSVIKDNETLATYNGKTYPLSFFGDHNLQNMAGAMVVCNELGIESENFLKAMQSFKGAARRLQIVGENDDSVVFYDFAHAPSKVKATMDAVRARYPDRHLTACFELHSFSSLNHEFLPHYRDTMKAAHSAIVFFDPQVVAHKKLPEITIQQVAKAFNIPVKSVLTNATELKSELEKVKLKNANLLIMTSGNFAGINIKELTKSVLG